MKYRVKLIGGTEWGSFIDLEQAYAVMERIRDHTDGDVCWVIESMNTNEIVGVFGRIHGRPVQYVSE
jgi:hypothetical protein